LFESKITAPGHYVGKELVGFIFTTKVVEPSFCGSTIGFGVD